MPAPVGVWDQQGSTKTLAEERADSLTQSLLWICRQYGLDMSADALYFGLPKTRYVDPSLALRALNRAGVIAGLIEREVDQISSYLFPVILLKRDHGGCIILRRSNHGEGTRYDVLMPEESEGVITLTEEDINRMSSGYVIIAKQNPKIDKRAGDPMPEGEGHWLVKTIWRYRRYYYSAAFGAILTNVLALASTFFTMNVYDRVVPNQAFVTLWSLAIGVCFAMCFEFIAKLIRAHVIDVAGKKADLILGAVLFNQAMSIRMEHKPQSSGAFANQLKEFESVRDFAASATLATITDLPFTLFFVLVVAFIGGPLAWVPLLAIPIVVLIGVVIQWPLAKTMQENLRESSLKQGVVIESVDGLESLKAVGGEGFMQKRWEQYSALASKTAMKSKALSSSAVNAVALVQQLETVVMVVWGVYLIQEGRLTQGALIGSVILAGRALAPLAQVAALAVRFQQAKAALLSLNKLMAIPTERDEKIAYIPMPHEVHELTLREAKFGYPAAPNQQIPPVLKGVSLTIKRGERIAILGRIGSGKSTLLKVIGRILQVKEGQMLADGIDASQLDPVDWRRLIGYVGQDSRLFHGTLRQNMLIGCPDVASADLLNVLRLTGLDEVAARHPQGLELPIGEMGQGLSGGQRQLVILARTLLRKPEILLLDEPTSAMDAQTEAVFMSKFSHAMEGRTFVIVTHRYSLLEMVDRIIVIDDGRIVVDGPKAEVLEKLAVPRR
jgi:ATP-binding cassette subfamily C protein LapB